MKSSFFQKYLLPGFVFQSLMIGGGYGTGREIVEFFLKQVPLSGLVNMAIATGIISIVLAVCFEFARIGNFFEYRSFIKGLLGKGWIAYDIIYLIMLILIVSVMGSASGEIFNALVGAPELVGIIIMMIAVGFIVFKGTKTVEKIMSLWSFILYTAFIFMFIMVVNRFYNDIIDNFSLQSLQTNWAMGGIKYAAYNIGMAPAILFCARHFETRKEAISAGLIGGILGMIPALILFLVMLSHYPQIISEAIPVNHIIENIGLEPFRIFFQIVLFGTFIETGAGIIHGFNERIFSVKPNLTDNHRAIIGISILFISIFLANTLGLINLISKGYGLITWGFWIIFLIPVLTLGVNRIIKNG